MPKFDDFDDEYRLEDDFNWPVEDFDHKRIALFIMNSGGQVEDILYDINDILEYVKKIYETYSSAD